MAIEWTPEQKKAIETRGCNVLVAAAAGSGKTAVLVERIVRLITDPDAPTDIDKMLVTTFTEAAASKMKHEIAQALEKRLEATPGDKNLSRQLVLLDNARICTVHAFCMRLVRTGFQKLDNEPDFSIGDDGEMKLLLEKSMDALFEELYEAGDEGFLDLLESYTTARSDMGLRDILLKLYHFASSLPFKAQYFEKVNALYQVEDIRSHPWFELICKLSALRVTSCIVSLQRCLDISVLYDGMIKYTQALEEEIADLKHLQHLLETEDFARAGAIARSFKLRRAATVKGDVDEARKKQISEQRKAASKLVGEIGNNYFPEDMSQMLADLLDCGKKAKSIGSMVQRLDEIYLAEKKSRGVLDFSDLEHMAVRLLCDSDENGQIVPSAEAKEIAAGLDYILVDEFQDTNELQETIFSMISRGDNLFMVGDVKQSIYRFRHTNPYIFKSKKDTYSDTEGTNRRVIMSNNFRSRDSVIAGVNQVFERTAGETVGEITYDETERLNAGFPYPPADGVTSGGKTEILIAERAREIYTDCEAEAHIIAQRICALLQSGYQLYDAKKQCMRKPEYKDIVILMRAYKDDGPVFAKILGEYGIPCYADSSGGYFENTEITFMLSLLKVIDNPYQDIDLIAVLRSVLFRFDENELLAVRLTDKEKPFYDCVCQYAAGADALAAKCAAFVEKIEKWRSYVHYMTTYELIGALYRETDYDLFATGQRNGEYRRENLNILFERARSFEGTGFKGLFNFVSYVDGLRKAQTGDGDAKLISEAQNVVQIMSIHKSKGLEYGIVFLARAGKGFNNRDLSSVMLMHKTLGLGFDCVDKLNCYKYPSAAKLAIKEKLNLENLSEELRILYVAMTRAREKLIITGTVSNFEAVQYVYTPEQGQVPLYVTSGAKSYLDWILPAVLLETQSPMFETGAFETDLFSIRLYDADSLLTADEAAATMQREPEKSEDKKNTHIFDVMTYSYPYAADTALPSKVSVTEVKRMLETELDLEAVGLYDSGTLNEPQFEDAETRSGAKSGSVTHYVLQHLDLAKVFNEAEIVAQMEAWTAQGMLTKQECAMVQTRKIAAFFASPLGRRMLQSTSVQREFPFEILVPAKQLFSEYTGDDNLLLQGVIDCFFTEGDGLVLVDYKTDHVNCAEDIERIKQRYGVQLNYYAQALKQLTGKRVQARYLYLFSAGHAVEVQEDM